MTDKMMEGFENCSLHDGYADDRRLEENRTWFIAGWQAAKSVPVVVEPVANQCDGCNRGLQVCDDGLHREPSGHPVMACTRSKYTTSITAQELDALRKDPERPDCGTCANRGRVDGLSQETFCEHCSWSEKWRKNNYKPIAMQERQ